MAKATLKERQPKPRKVKVVLELTGEEARALMALVGHGVIGGGPRVHTDAIWRALGDVGVSGYTEKLLMTGRVDFQEYPKAAGD